MNTVIIYESKHHGNTKKLCDRIAGECNIRLVEAKIITNNFEWESYDIIGLASGIAYNKFYKNVNKAALMIPDGKKVFFIYTCAKNNKDFSKDIQNILMEKGCECLGSYGCKGYNTFGPLKLIGGMNKENPTQAELRDAVQFVKEIELTYRN